MPVDVNQITNQTSTGVLDVLIAKVNHELSEQFQKRRINSDEYGQVYVSALNALIGQSIQYVTAIESANNQAALILAQKAQVEAETQLTNKKILQAQKEIDLLDIQLQRANVEKALLEAKVNTEKAQYLDIVDGNPVGGIIGKQKSLYDSQSAGFLRDAEQKLLKILSDIWSVQKSVDPAIDPLDTGMHDGNINVVAIKAIQGIGATPVAPPTAP